MKIDLKKMMRILAEKQLSEMQEDIKESENDDMEDEDKNSEEDKIQSKKPNMKNADMKKLANEKRKAIILIMLKNKKAKK